MKTNFYASFAACALVIALSGLTYGAEPSAQSQAGKAAVSTSGNVTTISGEKDQPIPPIKFEQGSYVFNWDCKGSRMTLVLNSSGENAAGVMSINELQNGCQLFAVDNALVKPGELTFAVTSDGSWTIKVTKQTSEGAAELPQTLSANELKSVVSKPFAAKTGKIKIKYAYKGLPKGTGTLRLCDVKTGAAVPSGMIFAGKASGEIEMDIPATGIYIAQTTFPLASGGGDVTLSQ
jgi:hypothetical protein